MAPPFSFVNAPIQPIALYYADPRRNAVAIAAGEAAWRRSQRVSWGAAEHCGDTGGFAAGQVSGAFLEVTLRAGFRAICADAGLGDVQVNLHDPRLAP